MQAQITRTAFEQRRAHRQAQGFDQQRQIPAKQLVLQVFCCRRDQHTLAAHQGRHQIGKGFADAGSCLDHQSAAVLQCSGNRQGHLCLPVTRPKRGQRPRQLAIGAKCLTDQLNQAHKSTGPTAGLGDFTGLPLSLVIGVRLVLQAHQFVTQLQAALFQPFHQQFIRDRGQGGTVNQGIQI